MYKIARQISFMTLKTHETTAVGWLHLRAGCITVMRTVFAFLLVWNSSASSQGRELSDPPKYDFPPAASVVEGRLQDLQMLEPYLNLNKSYTAETRLKARELLEGIRVNIETLSDLQFLIEVHRIIALADNAHSEGRFALFPRGYGSLPFRGYWFDGDYHIIRTKPDYKDLLGSRVTHYGDMAVEEVAIRLKSQLSGGPLEFFRAVVGDALMVTPALLYELNLIKDPSSVEVHLVLPNGHTEVRIMKPSTPGNQENPTTASGRLLFPNFKEHGFSDWDVFEIKNKLPLYLSGKNPLDHRYQFKWLGPQKVPYMQFRGNFSTNSQSLPDFIKGVQDQLKEKMHRWIIVDMRLNQGGDLTITHDFFSGLPERLTRDGKIYALIGNRTFSAGIAGVAFMKQSGGDRVILLGENMGDREQFWSELVRYELPNSKIRLTYADALHDLEHGCTDRPECYWWYSENTNPSVGELDPEIFVPTRFSDYANGRDPLLEKIEELEGIKLK